MHGCGQHLAALRLGPPRARNSNPPPTVELPAAAVAHAVLARHLLDLTPHHHVARAGAAAECDLSPCLAAAAAHVVFQVLCAPQQLLPVQQLGAGWEDKGLKCGRVLQADVYRVGVQHSPRERCGSGLRARRPLSGAKDQQLHECMVHDTMGAACPRHTCRMRAHGGTTSARASSTASRAPLPFAPLFAHPPLWSHPGRCTARTRARTCPCRWGPAPG